SSGRSWLRPETTARSLHPARGACGSHRPLSGSFFKSLDGELILRVVARARRELAKAHGPEFPDDCRIIERDGELLMRPLHQIDETPTHHAMDRRDGAGLDYLLEGKTLRVVELRLWP